MRYPFGLEGFTSQSETRRSNSLLPAWENARRLNLKNNLVYGTHFWLKRSLQFSVFEIRAHLNGIQTGYGFFLELAEVMILREETL